jgi:hypothetical protein
MIFFFSFYLNKLTTNQKQWDSNPTARVVFLMKKRNAKSTNILLKNEYVLRWCVTYSLKIRSKQLIKYVKSIYVYQRT